MERVTNASRRVFLTRPESHHSRDEITTAHTSLSIMGVHCLIMRLFFRFFTLRRPRFICNTRPHAFLTPPAACASLYFRATRSLAVALSSMVMACPRSHVKPDAGCSSLRFYISDQVVFSAFGSSSLGALLWYHSNGIVPSA